MPELFYLLGTGTLGKVHVYMYATDKVVVQRNARTRRFDLAGGRQRIHPCIDSQFTAACL